MLLTLSSVAKRTKELGTLKAIGWPQSKVVRQVSGESLVQGALGGVVGAVLGIGAAAAVSALGLTLKASVAAAGGGGGRARRRPGAAARSAAPSARDRSSPARRTSSSRRR